MSAYDQVEYDEEAPSRVNLLPLLNVMHSEGPTKKMLMHVNVIMNRAQVKAMVDSEATHKFVASHGASRLR